MRLRDTPFLPTLAITATTVAITVAAINTAARMVLLDPVTAALLVSAGVVLAWAAMGEGETR